MAASPAHRILPHRIQDVLAIYSGLDSSAAEIRVLKLSPSDNFAAPINCNLVHVQLKSDAIEEYEALSYVWDEPHFVHSITLNGKPHQITKNLELALRYLRSARRERTLWVDALCINQRDLTERSKQAQLMKEIYSRSKVVLAWLPTFNSIVTNDDLAWSSDNHLIVQEAKSDIRIMGEAMELTRRICLRDYGTLLHMHATFLRAGDEFDIPALRRGKDPQAVYAQSQYLPIDAPFLLDREQSELMRRLFIKPPFWKRLWIMQEMSLGRRLVLVAGHHELSWRFISLFLRDAHYSNAFHASPDYNYLPKLLNYVFAIPLKIEYQRLIQQKSARRKCLPPTLLDVLMRFAESKATDPRDYVYGVLGLVNDRLGIQVNYYHSQSALFTETALAIINSTRTLDLICQTVWRSRHDPDGALPYSVASTRLGGLPYWVPNFADSLGFHQHETLLFGQKGIYAAAEPSSKAFQVFHHKYLGVMATVIGSISRDVMKDENDIMRKGLYCQGSYPFGAAIQFWNTELRQWLTNAGLDLARLECDELYSLTGETLVRALWRTLTTDCIAYPVGRTKNEKRPTMDRIFRGILNGHSQVPVADDDSANAKMGFWSEIMPQHHEMIRRISQNWTFAVTRNGLFTMMQQAQPGDVIACVRGARVPLILRPRDLLLGRQVYTFVGTAYVHGFMDGEARKLVKEGRLFEKGVLLN
ncbi:unnamed protein product [Clonostachys rosea f. rosea IK726]|jgi:hypothetical protein|uniref:Heterokaryon incompatibility domain-containing protein n=2 Tax=Bionectria ochroleuca TaxID=29856 RepID=A0A0B7K0B4_BIOOC|nr:unnamed protein product [Clonostachys rosea f. rosea IK726]